MKLPVLSFLFTMMERKLRHKAKIVSFDTQTNSVDDDILLAARFSPLRQTRLEAIENKALDVNHAKQCSWPRARLARLICIYLHVLQFAPMASPTSQGKSVVKLSTLVLEHTVPMRQNVGELKSLSLIMASRLFTIGKIHN